MTVLITGGTGLVGSRLLRRLAESNIPCRALVRSDAALPDGVSAVEGDILEPASLARAVAGVTAVVHLAAAFRTPDEALIWRVNLEGTRNLIAAVKSHARGARVIMASTSHVYGPASPRPAREDDAVAPTHAYPASKVAAENALRQSGVNWTILRLPFVYGDRDGHLDDLPGHVADTWHPAQRMSVVHHRDVAAAMRLALDGAMDGRIVNITDDGPTSVYELVRLAGATMAPSAEPLAHPWYLQVDGSLARTLGFQPGIATIHQAARQGLL